MIKFTVDALLGLKNAVSMFKHSFIRSDQGFLQLGRMAFLHNWIGDVLEESYFAVDEANQPQNRLRQV